MKAKTATAILLHCAALAIFLGAFACGRAVGEPTRIQEAYSLLDRGENAAAVSLLEGELRRGTEHPDEVRTLLASAYVGLAGVNIVSIFDAFKDFIFQKSLGEMIFKREDDDQARAERKRAEEEKRAAEDAKSRRRGAPGGDARTRNEDDSDLDELTIFGTRRSDEIGEIADARLRKLSATLAGAQKIIGFLDSFPDVAERKWPLLQSALDELDQVPPSPDLLVYKAFVRLVRLKSYLREKMLGTKHFGSLKWACTVELVSLEDPIDFLTDTVRSVSIDLDAAVAAGGKKLAKPAQGLHELVRSTTLNDTVALFHDESLVWNLQTQLRVALGCVQYPIGGHE